MASFETVLIGANGWMNSKRQVKGLVFKGIGGTNYGPYGETSGSLWETDIPLGCSVQYVSGLAGSLLESISFHYNCPTLNTTITEGMNTNIHTSIHVSSQLHMYVPMYVLVFISHLSILTTLTYLIDVYAGLLPAKFVSQLLSKF